VWPRKGPVVEKRKESTAAAAAQNISVSNKSEEICVKTCISI